MKSVSLVSLDCSTGEARRYYRVAGNKPVETGRLAILDWRGQGDDTVDWPKFGAFLMNWRGEWTPPEDPGPRPTSPPRMVKAA
jgi:hypothetical protein